MSTFYSKVFFCCIALATSSCAITEGRPVQELSNTAAAIRAAREVQADSKAPELYRQANEWFFKARQEYKLKNFKEARQYAEKARKFAEDAEFDSLNAGAHRVAAPPDPMSDPISEPTEKKSVEKPKPTPEDPANPGVFVESYEDQEQYKRKLELEKASRPPATPPNQVIIQQFPITTQPLVGPSPTPVPR